MKASYKVVGEDVQKGLMFEDIPENHLCKITDGKYSSLRYIKIPVCWINNQEVNAIELKDTENLIDAYRACKVTYNSNFRYIDLGPVVSVEVKVKL